MDEHLIGWIGPLFMSAWILPIVFVLAAVDGFLPLVPSESVVITAGAFAAATGRPGFVALVIAAALGAFAGDTISYLLGRRARHRILGLLARTRRRRKVYAWARHALHTRGGQILVTARFVPGGRTATTLTAGAIGYPRRMFQAFAALAAACWAVYSVLLGYLGGLTADGSPVKGMAIGLGFGLAISVVIELVRRRAGRRSSVAAGRAAHGDLFERAHAANALAEYGSGGRGR
ncbi:DedA family protein [Flindersiella endophytica]